VITAVMANAEALVIGWLLADDGVSDLVGDRVFAEIPALATYPLVVAFRWGGEQKVRYRLDEAYMQVDSWSEVVEKGGSKPQAHDVAAAVRASMASMAGSITFGGVTGTVLGADERAPGLMYLPDPVTSRPRYVDQFAVFVHP
jgi:Protein of unknown function (DUF3168)